jgi:thioredoxin reductase (NADPH)
MSTTNQFDLVIVGGGPIGLACGLEAKKAGLHYCILEKGCLVNSLYNYPVNMTFFSTSEKLEIGGIPFVSNNNKPTRPEALEYYRRVATSNKLNIHLQEMVTAISATNGKYNITTSKGSYHSTYVVIATGFYDIPIYMNIPGEDLPKVVHYYREPHYYAMQKVLVVVRHPEIGERVKYWVKPDIENRIKEGSIQAFFNSSLVAIREKEVDIQTPDKLITIPNDYVIAMTGYQPNCAFLKEVGIHLSEDETLQPTYDPETMETNLPNLYLAGVVCGGMNTHVWFIENSRDHARLIMASIQKKMGVVVN